MREIPAGLEEKEHLCVDCRSVGTENSLWAIGSKKMGTPVLQLQESSSRFCQESVSLKRTLSLRWEPQPQLTTLISARQDLKQTIQS